LIPIDRGDGAGQAGQRYHFIVKRRLINMLWIIALILIAVGVLAVLGFALHLLFSPWLWLIAIGFLVWVKVRPRRSRR
jgi:1,4-dihydroxy-2-naphthoate octaprenyltransferase